MMWDTFDSRLLFTAELVTKTGLRVGAGGRSAEPTASDLPVMKTADGKPFIPGSSLRGVLRSHIERIVRAFEPDKSGNGKGACNPLAVSEKEGADFSACVTDGKVKAWREELRNRPNGDLVFAQRVWDNSCRVCRVFGSPWLASRVRISDLPCLNGAEAETRDAVAIDREKETVANKYDFEAVPVESRFGLEIVADNLDEAERGLLWLGIEELRRGQILVGGFKGRGLGRVALENLRLRFLDRKSLRNYLLSGEMPLCDESNAQAWLEKLLKELAGGGQ